jgi:hypothetical protein
MTLDQCSSMTVSDLNWTKIILAKKKKIAKYKSLLLRT